MKFISVIILFLLAYGSFAQQDANIDNIKLFEDIIVKVEKEYVWPVSQKTLIGYAIENVLNKLDSELSDAIRIIPNLDEVDSIEYFEEVLAQIEKEFSNSIDQKTLIEYAIAGIFSKLDSYSYYLDSEKFKKMQLQMLELHTVSTNVMGNIVHIKISEFNESACDHFRRQWLNIKENNNTINGIILDLRNNHGGLFSQAISVCNSFLDGGEIVTVQSGGMENKKHYTASKGDMFSGLPIIVLINEKSASASEIVAAALQNNKRAKIVGVKSFGKASGQTIFPLKNGGAISITNKLYYFSSESLIIGVIPDMIVTSQNYGQDYQLAKGIEILNSM